MVSAILAYKSKHNLATKTRDDSASAGSKMTNDGLNLHSQVSLTCSEWSVKSFCGNHLNLLDFVHYPSSSRDMLRISSNDLVEVIAVK